MTLRVDIKQKSGSFDLNISHEFPAGLTAIYGRSGSGKTSIIHAIAGISGAIDGAVYLGQTCLVDSARGMVLPTHKRRLAVVFQTPNLFPHMTVEGNLTYAARIRGQKTDASKFTKITDFLGIAPLLSRRVSALSGGEAQRVAIGRALLSDPEALLLDEPLSALDAARKAEIMPYIERLRDQTDIPILYVTHDVREVARLADEVVIIEAGRIVHSGRVRDVLADPERARLIGIREVGSVLAGRVVAHDADGLSRISITGGELILPHVKGEVGEAIRLRIGAQDVILATKRPEAISAQNILHGYVAAITMKNGPGAIVKIAIGEEFLLARITRRSLEALDIRLGIECYAIVKSVAIAPDDVALIR